MKLQSLLKFVILIISILNALTSFNNIQPGNKIYARHIFTDYQTEYVDVDTPTLSDHLLTYNS